MGRPRTLFYFRPIKHQFYIIILDFSKIQTRIVGVEGMHADHSTTATGLDR